MKRRPIQPSGKLADHLATFTPPPNATAAALFAAWEDWYSGLRGWLDAHPEDRAIVEMAMDSAPVPDAPWDYDAL